MKLSHNKALYEELFIEIARMHNEVDYRKHLNAYHGQKGKRKDYPAVSVGAELAYVSAIGHHHSYSTSSDFHPLVLQELLGRLGSLNDNSVNCPLCRNKVGHCAENYAVSGILRKIDPDETLYIRAMLCDIHFTMAFQPRTWKSIEWCENCHTIFD